MQIRFIVSIERSQLLLSKPIVAFSIGASLLAVRGLQQNDLGMCNIFISKPLVRE